MINGSSRTPSSLQRTISLAQPSLPCKQKHLVAALRRQALGNQLGEAALRRDVHVKPTHRSRIVPALPARPVCSMHPGPQVTFGAVADPHVEEDEGDLAAGELAGPDVDGGGPRRARTPHPRRRIGRPTRPPRGE